LKSFGGKAEDSQVCGIIIIRREDDEQPRTPLQSPFRRFDVKDLKCGSYRLTLTSGFNETAGKQQLLPPVRSL
jgi:hypothetical protein